MKLLRKKTPSVVKHAEPENPLLSKIRDLQGKCKSLEKRDQEIQARMNMLDAKVNVFGDAARQLLDTDTKLIKILQTGGRVVFD